MEESGGGGGAAHPMTDVKDLPKRIHFTRFSGLEWRHDADIPGANLFIAKLHRRATVHVLTSEEPEEHQESRSTITYSNTWKLYTVRPR